jgi:RNA polymerase primary sigma factor
LFSIYVANFYKRFYLERARQTPSYFVHLYIYLVYVVGGGTPVSFAIISRQVELDLFRRYRERSDLEARDTLVHSQIALAKRQIANQCRGNRRMLDDLMPDAALASYEAVERFDTARGVRLSTTIRFAVMSLCKKWRQNQAVVRVPLSAIRRLSHVEHSLYAADGHLREDFNSAFVERYAINEEAAKFAEVRSAILLLSPKLRDILRRRFWQQETLQRIGEDLGVTKQRVRQLQVQAMDELKDLISQARHLSLRAEFGVRSTA